jgi:rubrerythrin
MSIIWTLRKYVDAIEHREEEAARERDRRLAGRQALGDGEEEAEVGPPAPEKLHGCRVCGHRSLDPTYCPVCLADTMVPLEDEDG